MTFFDILHHLNEKMQRSAGCYSMIVSYLDFSPAGVCTGESKQRNTRVYDRSTSLHHSNALSSTCPELCCHFRKYIWFVCAVTQYNMSVFLSKFAIKITFHMKAFFIFASLSFLVSWVLLSKLDYSNLREIKPQFLETWIKITIPKTFPGNCREILI